MCTNTTTATGRQKFCHVTITIYSFYRYFSVRISKPYFGIFYTVSFPYKPFQRKVKKK